MYYVRRNAKREKAQRGRNSLAGGPYTITGEITQVMDTYTLLCVVSIATTKKEGPMGLI